MVYINDNHKLIFIENPKTGSTCLYNAFKKLFIDLIEREKPEIAHMTCEEVKNMVGSDKWYSYLKISTKRNPFKRFVSCCNFNIHQKKYNNLKELEEHLKSPGDCVYCIPQEQFTKECDVILDIDNDLQNQFNNLCDKLNINKMELIQSNVSSIIKKYSNRELLKIWNDHF